MGGVRLGGRAVVPVVDLCSPPLAAYQGSSLPGAPNIWRSCPTDAAGDMTQITDFDDFTEADQCHNPVLSPDGTKILFEIQDAPTNRREIWVVDAVAGSTGTPLVTDASNYVIQPSWHPDSDTFTYVHCAGGALTGGTVYKDTVSSPGSPVSLKAATGGRSPFRPQFNFDGTRVAYVFTQDSGSGSGELRVMDDDGTNDAAIFSTLQAYRFNQPTMHSWANGSNVIAFETGASGSNAAYVINDDGSGQQQINAAGDALNLGARISHSAWPADDSFVVYTCNTGSFFSPIRAELDGSDTTILGTIGGVNQNYFQGALVFNERIWLLTETDAAGGDAEVSSMALDGTDEIVNFNSGDASDTLVEPFTGGDGFLFN